MKKSMDEMKTFLHEHWRGVNQTRNAAMMNVLATLSEEDLTVALYTAGWGHLDGEGGLRNLVCRAAAMRAKQ